MQGRLLVKTDGKIAVAMRLAGVRQKMSGTVHRLDAEGLTCVVSSVAIEARLDDEHVLAIVFPVPGPFPERLVVDERRLHFHVAGGEEDVAHVVRERVVKRRALVEPERGAWRPRVKREEPELAAEFSMIALFRFLDLREMRFEILLRE